LIFPLAAQGALLLVLFQVSHTVEHKLTDQAQGNLRSLFDSIPESATLVELGKDGEPNMDSQRQVKASDVRIGSTMLVKPGEQVRLAYLSFEDVQKRLACSPSQSVGRAHRLHHARQAWRVGESSPNKCCVVESGLAVV